MICETEQDVLNMVKDTDVSFIQFWFTDVLGILKSFAVTPSELEEGLTEGMGFDGSSIQGFARIEESDMIAKPDPTTFQFLPWRPSDKPVARMFCDILQPDGSPYEADPRYVLKRILKKAADKGYTFYAGPELEYFYFRDSSGTEPLDRLYDQCSQEPKDHQNESKHKSQIADDGDVGRFPYFAIDTLKRQIDLDGAQPLPGAMDRGGQAKLPRAVRFENPMDNHTGFIGLPVLVAGASAHPATTARDDGP